MNQYPDEDEEFELRYQDELEMLDEEEGIVPKTDVLMSHVAPMKVNTLNILDSPHLSQISYGGNESLTSHGAGPVNRRLFGTPKGPIQRGTSTPLTAKNQLAPIQEVVHLPAPPDSQPVADDALASLRNIGVRSKRRLEQDLFGNIDDLYHDETYEDPLLKKARTEEQRDLDLIEKILEKRKQMHDVNKIVRPGNLSRLQAVHDFKMKNLSYTVPKWPFLPIRRSDDERIYVRFHSEQYETQEMDNIKVLPNFGGLLGESKQQVWAGANEIILRRTSAVPSNTTVDRDPSAAPVFEEGTALWVDKYKPRKYINLLSDESTNRSLLYWLKMWDKVVFGKEFKVVQELIGGKLNSFNKRTGKFESNGGWKQRKNLQMLNTNVDELGRPIQKVALLCGPPGLGKTTLAHTIARHAGYAVREINASDDRSPEAFKLGLENGTQMSSVLNEDRRPNCIILDEIDGAPRQSIEFLVKFVSDTATNKVRKKGASAHRNILKRPIICICNDLYDPALRPLRAIAFVVSFPPIESARLAERLMQIAHRERLRTDFGSLIALAEKSGNDVRCCISTMQFFSAQRIPLTLTDVLNSQLGQKDRHQGLFDVWGAIFRIQRPRKQLEVRANNEVQGPEVSMTDMSVGTRVRTLLEVVHSGGDYERLMQGVYENFLQQKMPDPYLNGVVEALQWFSFSDILHRQINQLQNYTVYPYLQYGFVSWHLLFASLAWPKISFPKRGFEFNQKSVTQKHILQAFRKGITTGAVGVGQGSVMLVETVPLLKRILAPHLRSVTLHLLSTREQSDLRHTVEVMVDLGLTYTQLKSTEGPYNFQMEPDLDLLLQFPGYTTNSLPYFSRQLIMREVELEKIRRAAPKSSDAPGVTTGGAGSTGVAEQCKKPTMLPPQHIPNHLQRLNPKRIDKDAKASTSISKDFFGRIQRKDTSQADQFKTDAIIKSPIWFRFKEGVNNAVRKDVLMKDVL